MNKYLVVLGAALVFALPILLNGHGATVEAARFERGQAVTITDQELVSQNIYMAGGQVTFSSTAQKDLLAAGGKVIDNGPIWGDVGLAGGTVDLLADVRGDVRIAGGQVTIQGVIGGDVIVAGGQVTILPGTTIGGDLVAVGGTVDVQGTVNGQTKVYGGTVSFDGTFAGPMFVTSKGAVTFGDKTIVGSTLTYRSPTEATVVPGAKMGDKVTYSKLELPTRNDVAKVVGVVMSVIFIIKLIALMLTSALAAQIFPKTSAHVASETISRFTHMLLIGLCAIIGVPILGVALLLTVVGMYIGGLVLVLYGLLLVASTIALPIVTGALIAKVTVKEPRVTWKWALLGALVVSLVSLIPILGWIAVILVYLAGVGTVSTELWRDIRAKM